MCPNDIVIVLGLLIGAAAWCGHTLESRAFADDIIAGLRICAMSKEELAIEMGIAPESLSRQLAGTEPLNALRLYGKTPIAFRIALTELQVKRLGIGLITPPHLTAVVTRLDDATALLARVEDLVALLSPAHVGPLMRDGLDQFLAAKGKVMAKAELPRASRRLVASKSEAC